MNNKGIKKGKIFSIPLKNGTFVFGQEIERIEELDTALCAFYSINTKNEEKNSFDGLLINDNLISVQIVTPDLIDKNKWKTLSTETIKLPNNAYPLEKYKKSGWVGARVIGSAIIVDFLNAFFGLEAWDSMTDPEYFDNLLINKKVKPNELLFKNAT